MKKMIFATFLAVTMLGFAQEADAPKPEPKGEAPAKEAREFRRQRPPMKGGRNLFTEITEMHAKAMTMYDKDKDGKLSEEEKAAVDADLNLEALQEKLRMARAWNMFKMLDKNNDGVLSEEEMTGMRNMRPVGARRGPNGPREKGDKPPRHKMQDKKPEKPEE